MRCTVGMPGNEPFVLLIGKHIYRSNTAVTCVKQLINEYDKHGSSIMGPSVMQQSTSVRLAPWRASGKYLVEMIPQ